jgi:hypothetical protein
MARLALGVAEAAIFLGFDSTMITSHPARIRHAADAMPIPPAPIICADDFISKDVGNGREQGLRDRFGSDLGFRNASIPPVH